MIAEEPNGKPPVRRRRTIQQAKRPRTVSKARRREKQPLPTMAAVPAQRQVHYVRSGPRPQTSRKKTASIFASLLAVAAVVVGGIVLAQSLPASITINGASLNVGGDKTIADALRASGIKPKPGDLVAVDGSLLEEGGGEAFHATINGNATTDPQAKLTSGDVLEIGNGTAKEEPSTTAEQTIAYTFEPQGNGAIHLLEGEGTDGTKSVKTGSVSGLTVEEVTQEPVHAVRRNVSPDTGGDKVIALTFDDGPWADSTAQVLDVLSKHDAKATFFTVGDRISEEGTNLVKRAAAEGHQICSHSFDHAAGNGQSVNLGYMTPEEQVAEVEQGLAAIEAATGERASRVFRTPGGNYDDEVMRNIGSLISAEIGWSIDSQDWQKPGANAIAEHIESAWPGAIVLLHDGGGDRSQTVEALDHALPHLKAQGYRFVTIDELMEYPLT